MMNPIGLILKIARQILRQIVARIRQQIEHVRTDAYEPTQQHVNNLDNIWQAEDADAFRAEMQQEVLPQLQDILDDTLGLCTGIDNAIITIDEAEQQVLNIVDEIESKIKSITK